ncbi:hypothetical protein FE257_005937 [Aspergillus nanangensis]|uniref:Uncharacterized protein n=1 Tax=Aspergillus nanangensis TaxID=2582783 RepID=A0AAD4GV74_ASPNN|nr:hypothetical protein FE257_005937 [Aspergillus nanangensis]
MWFDCPDNSETEEPESPTALQAAINSGRLDAVRESASTADADALGRALCQACQKGKLDIVKLLMDIEGIDLNITPNGYTPLFLAAYQVEPDIVKILLDRGADMRIGSGNNKRESSGAPADTPLHGLFNNIPHGISRTSDYLRRFQETLLLLLETGGDINAQGSYGRTVLHICVFKTMPVLDLLLKHGANSNILDEKGNTCMHLLRSPLGNPSFLTALMAGGARLDIPRPEDGFTALHGFAANGQLGDLSLLRPFVQDWGLTDGKGNTVLHLAAKEHHTGSKTLTALIDLGLNPNQRNLNGEQPIHMVKGQKESVKEALDILCAAGADLEARDYQGRTLLSKQISGHPSYNCRDILPYLISRGANVNTQDYKGNTVLHYIVQPYVWKSEYLDFLLSIGADATLTNYNGDTVLHRLAANFATISNDTSLSAITKLLGTGISPICTNFKGQTPLHLLCSKASEHSFATAAKGGITAMDILLDAGLALALNIPDSQGVFPIHLAATISEMLVSMLIAKGADTASATNDGRNLLHIASMARQSNVVGLLLEHYQSADVDKSLLNAQSKDGRTPLHVASRSGRPETVSLLLAHGASVGIQDKRHRTPLDACAEFPEEDSLWSISNDDHNIFSLLSVAGVGIDEDDRPSQPSSNRKGKARNGSKKHQGLGWKGEISSESSSVGIKRIIQSLASHGALAMDERSRSGPYSTAVIAGCQEMIEALDRVSKNQGIELQNYHRLETDCFLLRSKHVPEILTNRFHEYFSVRDVLTMLLLGHEDELAQAFENNAEILRTHSSMPEILVILARWGYHELLGRIGKAMSSGGGVNAVDADQIVKPLIPSLLAAAQRELPNLEAIKVLVERFQADVNAQFKAGSAVKPKIYYGSKVATDRQYKPGDTVLHHLAQGGHWWYEGAIKYLLQQGADPNVCNDAGRTPLCHAVARGQLGGYRQREITKILLEGGADPNISAPCGYTPLAMATHNAQLHELLVQYGARPSVEHPMEIFSALDSLNSDVLSGLLSLGLDCNSVVLSDAQPHWHTQRVKKQPLSENRTCHPLDYVSMFPFNEANSRDYAIQMIHCLRAHGADPFLQFDDGCVILHEIFGRGGIIQPWLDMADLDLEHRDGRGRTLLLASASCDVGTTSYACTLSVLPSRGGRMSRASWLDGDSTRAMTLYERGADLKARDLCGNNVLHVLASMPSPNKTAESELRRTIALFMEKAPQLVHQENSDGKTPFHIAEFNQVTWAIESLRAPDEDGDESANPDAPPPTVTGASDC